MQGKDKESPEFTKINIQRASRKIVLKQEQVTPRVNFGSKAVEYITLWNWNGQKLNPL